ncbi:hypothetical protein [Microbacterium allomyrinae]|jgi:hypothetical protein|uniref:Uncharacterized protein n=1 Tax=Microbacterium allomyrinae TaxID=2830666 RepID=A0A9X1S1X8_9MICO|nr:hypothetical protein [Microbacterium allomyrinae]MCC2031364.1 hypothetical protein [Microbacterium allomyrinae]
MDRDLPEGVIDADPPGGWDEVGDKEAGERSSAAQAADAEDLLTDSALAPDDPVEGEAARRGTDPDLVGDADRGEEP